jgi:hypothetical protein
LPALSPALVKCPRGARTRIERTMTGNWMKTGLLMGGIMALSASFAA